MRYPSPRVLLAAVASAVAVVAAGPAAHAEPAPASLSDVRSGPTAVEATLVLRGGAAGQVDPRTLTATVGGRAADVTVSGASSRLQRSTMLVIDTSGSMEASGMATVRAAVGDFLAKVPKDVRIGVVSFASTAGVDVAPTTDHAKVRNAVGALRSKGETSLYAAVQVAVAALGTTGERSIVLLSDGGDTVAEAQGGAARERSQRRSAVAALRSAQVRAEVVAFKSPEGNGAVLTEFAKAGGGTVVTATDRRAVSAAFESAAQALESQVRITVTRPAGVDGREQVVVGGRTSTAEFKAVAEVDLAVAGPAVVAATPSPSGAPAAAPPAREASVGSTFGWALPAALLALIVGSFVLVLSAAGPSLRSSRQQRVSAIDQYGLRGTATRSTRQQAAPAAISEQLVQMGDRVMAGRESTTKTMELLDRADLPWRAGEWFVLRIAAVVVTTTVFFMVLRSRSGLVGLVVGLVVGVVLPAVALRFLARRRARQFESILPDVLTLVATSLASGFSLLQALDAVARDAAPPATKEFSRALAETRIGADVSDALEHMAERMDSENMRWATMAIRIQREVGGNLADTLRTTAATLREREMLQRQVRALSAEGRLSALILVCLPIGLLFYSMWTNYEYISLLWNHWLGYVMSAMGIVSMLVGILWMRSVVKIEV